MSRFFHAVNALRKQIVVSAGCACLLVIGIVLLSTVGCNKEKFDEMVESTKKSFDETAQNVKEQASGVVESASAQAGLSGNMTLTADKPISTTACYASLIEQAPDRPNVLKLRSYQSSASESWPSALIQAPVDDITRVQLSGKTVKAHVFIQEVSGGPIWSTNADEPAEIMIQSLQDDVLTATVLNGKLYNSHTDAAVDLNGSIESIFQ